MTKRPTQGLGTDRTTQCLEIPFAQPSLKIHLAAAVVWPSLQLTHAVWPESLIDTIQQIIDVARLAASIQTDGSDLPQVGLHR